MRGPWITPSLAAFVRHAERFGVECVYETAEAMSAHGLMTSLDRGCLARHLRRLDKSWRLTPQQRERLIAELRASGVRNREIAEMAGVSLRTVVGKGAPLTTPTPENRLVEPRKSADSDGYGKRAEDDPYFAFDPSWTDGSPPVKSWYAWVYGGARIPPPWGSRR